MCGRFTLQKPSEALDALFGLVLDDQGLSAHPAASLPRYNIAPSQPLLAVRDNGLGDLETVMLRWGLIPAWAKDKKIGYKLINARSETAAVKPSFRSAMKHRRCAILADGFYEWKRDGENKKPFYFGLKGRRPFVLAGLWERWVGDEGDIQSCCLLTTDANRVLQPVHHRMPVILTPEDARTWISSSGEPTDAHALMKPYPEKEMGRMAVGSFVNSARNEGPECIEPLV